MRMPATLAGLIVGASVVVGGCSCAESHMLPPQDASSDTTADAFVDPRFACVDLSLYSGRFLTPVPTSTECDDARRAACAATFQAFAPSGFARAQCLSGRPVCYAADSCQSTPTGIECVCGTSGRCSGVCVSDTPTGTPTCVLPCPREQTPPHDCAPTAAPLFTAITFASCPDPETDAICQLWAQGFAPPGATAHAMCAGTTTSGVIRSYCGMGDACTPTSDLTSDCTCGGSLCGDNEVCVTDADGTGPHCATACYPVGPA